MVAMRSTITPLYRSRRVLIIAIFVILCLTPAAVLAQDVSATNQFSDSCFAVADEHDPTVVGHPDDHTDTLTRINRFTGVPEIIGLTGTQGIEDIAFGPNHQLYAADGGQLGTLDLTTGLFTSLPQPVGVVNGVVNGVSDSVNVDDLDGLAYSLALGVFFGADRHASGELDLLVAIDPATGAHIPDFFGPGIDFVPVSAVPDDQGTPLTNVDGLASDPVTDLLYAAINEGGRDGVLATIDRATGTATKIFTFRFPPGGPAAEIIDDIEAISFFNDGTLYASTGDNFGADPDDLNRFYQIDRVTGVGTLIGQFPPGAKDFEALACLTADAAIVLNKYTNGPGQAPADADTPTGPGIDTGATVTWTYIFTNTGPFTLTNLILVDDQLGTIGPGGLSNCPPPGTLLGPGKGLTCIATGIAQPGQYANVATVTGLTDPNEITPTQTVSDTDPSHYFGLGPGISIKKYTNGADADGANDPDVPQILPNGPVAWTYVVENIGNVSFAKADVVVTDDQTGVTPVFASVLLGNSDDVLEPGEQWLYQATGTAKALVFGLAGTTVVEGCLVSETTPPRPVYENVGTVTAPGVSDTDPSHYCNPPDSGISIKKYTNGADADGANGLDVPRIAPNSLVTWTYVVENTGNVSFAKADVVVTDDQTGVTPVFAGVLLGNSDDVLEPGEQWLYQATGTAKTLAFDLQDVTVVPGCTAGANDQARPTYENVGKVTVGDLEDSDPSHYCNPGAPSPPLVTALGDYVWLDANENGLQDEGEAPVSGVTVTLYRLGTATPISTTTTNDQGLYFFENLPLGSYFIEIVPPSGFSFTEANVQNNSQDLIDSDLVGSLVTLGVSDGGIKARLSKPLTYTLSYSNTGTQDVVGVVLSTTVPAGTTADLGASTPGWSCAATPAVAGTICQFTAGNVGAGAKGSVQFVVVLGSEDSAVPDRIELAVSLTYTTSGRSHVSTPPANEIDPTLDAGLIEGAVSEETRLATIRVPVPTGLEEEDQPGQNRTLFLPALRD